MTEVLFDSKYHFLSITYTLQFVPMELTYIYIRYGLLQTTNSFHGKGFTWKKSLSMLITLGSSLFTLSPPISHRELLILAPSLCPSLSLSLSLSLLFSLSLFPSLYNPLSPFLPLSPPLSLSLSLYLSLSPSLSILLVRGDHCVGDCVIPATSMKDAVCFQFSHQQYLDS